MRHIIANGSALHLSPPNGDGRDYALSRIGHLVTVPVKRSDIDKAEAYAVL